MVLIGNSFFRPYAENLDVVAADAGYDDHSSTWSFGVVKMELQVAFGMIPLHKRP